MRIENWELTNDKSLGTETICHWAIPNSHLKNIRDAKTRRPFWGGGRGTLTLRSGSRSCRQLANRGSDLLSVFLAILNRHASTRSEISVALCLRVERETRLLGLAANFLGEHHL